MSEARVAGLKPWLPWPLAQWRSWTEPVAAQRLAGLRIGLSLVLLFDLLTNFGPYLHDLYGPDSLTQVAGRDLRAGISEAPHHNWSLLRGVGHPLNLQLAVIGTVILTLWLLTLLSGKPRNPPLRVGWLALAWTVFATLAVLGAWKRLYTLPDSVELAVE